MLLAFVIRKIVKQFRIGVSPWREWPQQSFGLLLSLSFKLFPIVHHVFEFDKALVLEVKLPGARGGMTLGSYIFVFLPSGGRSLLEHEYGHVLQSNQYGPLYFFKVAIPSFLRALAIRLKLITPNRYDDFQIERDATLRGKRYFTKLPVKFVNPGIDKINSK